MRFIVAAVSVLLCLGVLAAPRAAADPAICDYPSCTPGITGHAQVHLQYDTSIDDVKRKLHHDLEYIEQRTVWQDLKIMVKTIPVMLFRKGGW